MSLISLRCIWMFPMLQTQKLYFHWSLSQQASGSFHSKVMWILTPIKEHVPTSTHSNQHLFTSPIFLPLQVLDQLQFYTQAYTLSRPIQKNHHLPTQTSFQNQIHQHQDLTHQSLCYPSVLHHMPLYVQSLILQNKLRFHHHFQSNAKCC